jgi:hypothetical protein
MKRIQERKGTKSTILRDKKPQRNKQIRQERKATMQNDNSEMKDRDGSHRNNFGENL